VVCVCAPRVKRERERKKRDHHPRRDGDDDAHFLVVKERHTRGDVLCKDDDDDDDKEEEEEEDSEEDSSSHEKQNMPLYDLILQVKSHVPKGDVFNLLKRTSLKVIDADGVLMDVKSFGHQTLAYPYKKPNERHHEVQMSQLTFASAPKVLPDISHALRTDENVIRWMLLKRKKKMEPLIKYKAWTEEQRAAIESRESEMNRGRSRGSGSGRERR